MFHNKKKIPFPILLDLVKKGPCENISLYDNFFFQFKLPDEPHDWSNESMPSETIVDIWEMAHVKHPANLLEDLGFSDTEINLSRLLGVIDEELQNVHNDREFTPLLRVIK